MNATSPIGLAQNIIAAGKICANSGARVGISSILPRADFHQQLNRHEINTLLRGMCASNNFVYIDNSNIILSKHIMPDGVHLNNAGTKLFSENLLVYLNNEVSS